MKVRGDGDEKEETVTVEPLVAVTTPVKLSMVSMPEVWLLVGGSVVTVMAPAWVKSNVMPPVVVTALLRSKLMRMPVLALAVVVRVMGTLTVLAPNPVTVLGIRHTLPARQPSRVALELL